jgi:hypothetical protein
MSDADPKVPQAPPPDMSSRPPRLNRGITSAVLALFLAACSGGESAGPPTPKTVLLVGDTASRLIGDTVRFTGSIIMSNGDVGAGTLNWSTSNSSILTVSSTGVVVAVAEGKATITAASGAISASRSLSVHAGTTVAGFKLNGSGLTVMSTPAEIAAGTMVVSRTTAPPVAVGDVIAGSAGTSGGGYLRKVLTVGGSGTSQTLTTRPAALDEALIDGVANHTADFNIVAALQSDFNKKVLRNLPKGVTISPSGLVNFTDAQFDLTSTASSGPAQAKMTLSGSLGPRFGSDAIPGQKSIGIGLRIENARFTYFTAFVTAGMAFTGSAKVEFTGNFASALGFPRYSAKILPDIVLTKQFGDENCFFVGVLPVCYKATIHFNGYVEPIASVTGTLSQTVTITRAATAGVLYDIPLGWRPLWRAEGTTTVSPFNSNFGGTVGVKVGIVPELEVLLYGAAGPFVNLDAGVSLTAGLTNNFFRWFTNVKFEFEAGIGARAKVFGVTLAEYSTSFPLIDPINLAGTEGPAATVSMSPATVSLNVGATQVLTPSAVLRPFSVPIPAGTYNCISSNATVASVSGCTVTGVAAGSTTITAISNNYAPVFTAVPVTVSANVPLITFTPASMTVSHVVGVTTCPQLVGTLTVTNASSGTISLTGAPGNSALRLNGSATWTVTTLGAGQSTSVVVTFACTTQTTFTDNITITARNASGSIVQPYTVPVTVSISSPLISFSPTSFSAVHTFGVSSCPQVIGNLSVTNTSSGPINWTASAQNAGIEVSGFGTWTASNFAAGATTSTQIRFNCVAATSISTNIVFAVQTVSGSIVQTITIPVTLTVVIPMDMDLDVASVSEPALLDTLVPRRDLLPEIPGLLH